MTKTKITGPRQRMLSAKCTSQIKEANKKMRVRKCKMEQERFPRETGPQPGSADSEMSAVKQLTCGPCTPASVITRGAGLMLRSMGLTPTH